MPLSFAFDLSVTAEEMSEWSPDRIAYFFRGITMVARAKANSGPIADELDRAIQRAHAVNPNPSTDAEKSANIKSEQPKEK